MRAPPGKREPDGLKSTLSRMRKRRRRFAGGSVSCQGSPERGCGSSGWVSCLAAAVLNRVRYILPKMDLPINALLRLQFTGYLILFGEEFRAGERQQGGYCILHLFFIIVGRLIAAGKRVLRSALTEFITLC